jgi:hypothetical protein
VVLGLLANEEGLRIGTPYEPGTGDRIGSHRHSADGRGASQTRLLGNELAEREEASRLHDRLLRVNQICRLASARKSEVAEHQSVLAQLLNQYLSGIVAHGPRS